MWGTVSVKSRDHFTVSGFVQKPNVHLFFNIFAV